MLTKNIFSVMKKRKNIIILKTAVGSLPAVSLIKELKKKNVKIIGLDSDPNSIGFYFCDKSYVIPNANEKMFLKKIIQICDKEKPDIILPSIEDEIIKLTKNRKVFEQKNILIFSPDYETSKICADKLRTCQRFEILGVPTYKIFTSEIKFPCVIKPRFGRGGKDVFKIINKEELRFYKKKIKNPIMTEFLKGEEYSIDILADKNSIPISIIPRKRIKTESGISTIGVTENNEQMIDYCKKIVKEFRLVGPSCIQCFKYKKNIKFTEINNRFGGGSVLSIRSDPTIITNIIKITRDEKPIRNSKFKVGLTMLRYYDEIITTNSKFM